MTAETCNIYGHKWSVWKMSETGQSKSRFCLRCNREEHEPIQTEDYQKAIHAYDVCCESYGKTLKNLGES